MLWQNHCIILFSPVLYNSVKKSTESFIGVFFSIVCSLFIAACSILLLTLISLDRFQGRQASISDFW